MKKTISDLLLCIGAIWFCSLQVNLHAAEKAKVVFISGNPSHGPMSHEHRAGNLLLAKALNAADLDVNATVLPENGYPSDPSVLKNAATIVIFCTGHGGHVLNPKLEEFDALMKKGTGVVMIHWATEAVKGDPGNKFLEWMGGFCDLNWSVNPHWTPKFKPVDHKIWNGVKPFSVNDEWYYHMRFPKGMKGVTPILSDLPGPETLKRPDGARSGNPDVRRAVANGESQHVAWAYERPDGNGRGFGFTGAHNHVSWQNDSFRKIVLNAILWTARVEVPKNGVPSETPTDKEIRQNLDDKGKKKAPKKPPSREKRRTAAAPSFHQLREQNVRRLDSRSSLDLLARTLSATEDAMVQAALLRGMLRGLEGRRNLAAPEGWSEAKAHLSRDDASEVSQLCQRLSQIFGDQSAAKNALATVSDRSAPADDRRSALISLVTQQYTELTSVLESLLDDTALQVDAIRAYGTLEDKRAPTLLLARYAKLDFQARRAAVETLATRENYANSLLSAIKDKTVPREDVPAYIARALSDMLGDKFTTVYGDIQELSADKAELIASYKALLNPERLAKADASQGKVVFQTACAACHQLYGEGGVIGPDLTGSNRADIDYILQNMIDPSADVPDAYKQVTIITKGGQILVGTLAEEDDQRVVLNTVGQKATVLKSDVASRIISPMSMMPEGLLPTLQDSQVVDLVKYLQSTKQLTLSK